MAYDFLLPDLGEGIAEAEVRTWLVREGDRVEEHQNVVELETDKAVIEVPSPRAGVVTTLFRHEGETLRVGEALLRLAEEESPRTRSVVGQLPEAEDAPRLVATPAATPAATPTPAATALATPGVRALARERGLPLETLAGSGYKGSITREDVLAATSDARAGNQYGEVERRPLSATRRAIASRLGAAAASAVYVSAMAEFDVSELAAFRKRGAELLAKSELHLTYLPFILKALGLALKLHPALNAEFDEARGELLLKHYLNIGIAVDGPEGLLVPVIRDVDRKSPVDLARELGDLARRARDRRLTPAELRGSSFTVSNYGAFGGRFATPVPNHPDVAILGTGVIGERPWVVDGALAVRTVIPLSLTFDHRVADGGEATRFLAEIGRLLADPAALLLELR